MAGIGTANPWFNCTKSQGRQSYRRTYEVPYGHAMMVDEPNRLTEILLEVA